MKAIAIGKMQKAFMKALQGCVETSKTRPMLNHIYHDEEKHRLVSTNGKCMLVLDIPENGFWQKLREELAGIKYLDYKDKMLVESECGFNYPQYERVIPKVEGNKNYRRVERMPNFASGTVSGAVDLFGALALAGIVVKYDLIKPLGTVAFTDLYVFDQEHAAVATNSMMTYVIMPMRV